MSRVRFCAGDVCVVEVTIENSLNARGEGADPFEALASARRILEVHGILLSCNGARRDVYPSPMLRQAAAGRHAYVLTLPRTRERPQTVDIFAPAPNIADIATVDGQRAWFDSWQQSPLVESS
jgi:hypothetical protein